MLTDGGSSEDGDGALADQRAAVVEHAPALSELTPARTGNLSVRRDDRFAITPTGVAYDAFDAADVPVVTVDGEHVAGGMRPSSEVPMHAAIYRRSDAGAVVHTHSPWATTLAVLGDPLPPIHYMIVAVGKRVPVAAYAPYGTDDLAANVVDAMDAAESHAALIENHGLVVTAQDLPTAVESTVHVESLARLYLQARAVGDPTTLSDPQLETVARKFASYGQ